MAAICPECDRIISPTTNHHPTCGRWRNTPPFKATITAPLGPEHKPLLEFLLNLPEQQKYMIGDTVHYAGSPARVVGVHTNRRGTVKYDIQLLGLGPQHRVKYVSSNSLIKVPKFTYGDTVWYDDFEAHITNRKWNKERTGWDYRLKWGTTRALTEKWYWESDLLSDDEHNEPEEDEPLVGVDPPGKEKPEAFEAWWGKLVADNAPTIRKKAEEYGSNSLEEIGKLFDRAQGSGYGAHPLETGCFVYAYGKMQRVADAMLKGDKPSEDTWLDLMVYSAMALYIRQFGRWP